MESNDHPELDGSDLLDMDGIKLYQSLIGSFQWVISIGRIEIMTATMTMSKFSCAPRKGHLERLFRMLKYLSNMKHSIIRFRTGIPNYDSVDIKPYDWSNSVYRGACEIIPKDIPNPKGKPILITSYCDSNLLHDMISGKSVTGILHFLNKTPIYWFSKKQPTVCTSTYEAEFMATRTEVEQVIDLRCTLRYLGIPVMNPSMMFGDNASVVGSVNMPSSCMKKRHIILSFHKVREAVASGCVYYGFLKGEDNVADVLSKLWSYQCVWKRLQALLFWSGNTMDLFNKEFESGNIKSGKGKIRRSNNVGNHLVCGINTVQK